MLFIIILILSALLISACAGFFSIWGLAQLFSGAFWPVIIMGATLETGKLVTASYVYRFWNKINFLMKTYLISAVIILMIITSVGIFGFLSSAYQKDALTLGEITNKNAGLIKEKEELLFRKRQIDKDIASLPTNFITGRQRLMESYGPELNKINLRIDEITKQSRTLSINKIKQESHIGPIIYISKVLGKNTDDATKYMILLLIIVFDPLAVILIIAANIAIVERKKDQLGKAGNLIDEIDVLEEAKHEIQNSLSTKDVEKAVEKLMIKTDDDIKKDNSIGLMMAKERIINSIRAGS